MSVSDRLCISPCCWQSTGLSPVTNYDLTEFKASTGCHNPQLLIDGIVQQAAQRLSIFDHVEILNCIIIKKKDAPSGTAIQTALDVGCRNGKNFL